MKSEDDVVTAEKELGHPGGRGIARTVHRALAEPRKTAEKIGKSWGVYLVLLRALIGVGQGGLRGNCPRTFAREVD